MCFRWPFVLGFLCSVTFVMHLHYMFDALGDNGALWSSVIRTATRPRLLCWVKTHPKNHKLRAVHVKETWGRKCDIFLLVSTQKDSELGTVRLHVNEGHGLWIKERSAWTHVYKRYFNDADWFFKVDDDAYVIVENLRNFIKDLDTNRLVHYGARFRRYAPNGYMVGGPGYMLSKAALHRLVVDGFPNATMCRQRDFWGDDFVLGRCMDKLGIQFGDTRDAIGRHSFLPGFFQEYFLPYDAFWEEWVLANNYYPQEKGMNCCSDGLISFNWKNISQLYLAEFLIYHLRH